MPEGTVEDPIGESYRPDEQEQCSTCKREVAEAINEVRGTPIDHRAHDYWIEGISCWMRVHAKPRQDFYSPSPEDRGGIDASKRIAVAMSDKTSG